MRQTRTVLVLPRSKPRNPLVRALRGRHGGMHRGGATRPAARRALQRELQALHLQDP